MSQLFYLSPYTDIRTQSLIEARTAQRQLEAKGYKVPMFIDQLKEELQ